MKYKNLKLLMLFFCAMILGAFAQCAGGKTGKADSEQAELMLELLRNASEGELDSALANAVMETKGMDLIIEQQNKMATISKAQYRILLLSLPNEKVPAIEPVDSTERAKLGLQRLRKNVWPMLKWAMENVNLLEDRLAFLGGLDVEGKAKKIADSFLPEPLQSIPRIFFVMGGRAGFYASDDCVYMDMLSMSYSPKGVKPLVESDIIDFFAHEMHHVGYSTLRNDRLSRLELNEMEKRAFGFLSGLVAEGSATYLISGHGDINSIIGNRRYARYFDLDRDLREICEDILHSVMDGRIENDDDYSKAIEPLLGMGYHSAGSIIMHVIDEAGGQKSIMRVLQDPRLFLAEYNKAAEDLMARSEPDSIYLFDEDLANILANIGRR